MVGQVCLERVVLVFRDKQAYILLTFINPVSGEMDLTVRQAIEINLFHYLFLFYVAR